ncbi:MAG TPA: [protein-PII] uridylyltransferase [Pirellulaceae bacterium]|nr:[protein-PII] uridylyltransferase [Pirellulaceae bacterium]HMO92227.1 [protein-PII] uridylyltransferase [Pirellulaceae bacterium]HMP70736.1 [protein-PII] uridylyltransferase [Pirellulaceae bacterium]
MSAGLRDYVMAARERLNQGRERLRELHRNGAPGRRIVSGMSDLVDEILGQLFRKAVSTLAANEQSIAEEVAIVLHGGSGRRDMAPFSDVDFMLLCQNSNDARIPKLASRLSQDIVDAGFQLGQSVRTPLEACSIAQKDASTFSSLTESRFLAGNLELHNQYFTRLQRMSARNSTVLIRALTNARQKERGEFAETVFVLRPDIKRSRGGMRDVHLLRWLGFVKFGETDIDQLCRKNAITQLDTARIVRAYEFLLRIRNEMHFHAGRADDRLGKGEQLRIAEVFGYQGQDGVLPVEEFMRRYFDFTTDIRHITDQFVASMTMHRSLGKIFAPLFTRQVDAKFQVGPYQVGFTDQSRETASSDLENVLQLLDLSNQHEKQIDQMTWERVRRAMIESPSIPLTVTAAKHFKAMFADAKNIGRTIRKLHEMRVLEHLIVEFKHARNLVQFNEYHQFTVDEHSIQAVEIACQFQSRKDRLGKIYRSLREKGLLNLALLIHDLGKGFPEDHCEVGRRFAEAIGGRLQMSEDVVEDMKFLVHNHLMMSHTAFRRDINDEGLVAEFGANVGSVKLLKLLYLLTCADVSAVGPGVLNQWKLDLLTDLYLNAKNVLTGHHGLDGVDTRLESILKRIGEQIADADVQRWVMQQARNLPRNYCRQIPVELIAQQLLAIRDTIGDEVQCWVMPHEDNKFIDVCIGKREKIRSGIFYKVNGMLANKGFQILSADIKHLANSLVWYWFRIRDLDFQATAPARLGELEEDVRGLVSGNLSEPKTLRTLWKKYKFVTNPRQEIRVEVDNQTVQSATIIDVFAFQKFGFLYIISKEIFNLDLDVRFARVSTYGERVVNVFYVTDDQGNKIRDRKRLKQIQSALLEVTRHHMEIE